MTSIDNIIEKIKRDGGRVTKIRRTIVDVIYNQNCLITPPQILKQLDLNRIKTDRTTVYRELCFLLDRGIIRKIQLADQNTYYEMCGEHHHHLVCTKCKRINKIVLDKHLEAQEKEILEKENFKVQSHLLEFYGICSKCLKK
ncbi:MAG: Fur family transcriptional regulator [Candidatus Paceibacterota bacterium]